MTAEERVRQIRAALAVGDRAAADTHFVALLQESSKSTERWLRRVIVMTPAIRNASAYPVSADLRQELALDLWKHIAERRDMSWERTYWRALIYAQHHVATRYMRESGYWVDSRAIAEGRQALASLSVDYEQAGEVEAPNVLSTVEMVGDLRAAVMLLPPKERMAVMLRYWQGMNERDIGRALGCTDRTVRTWLQQAHVRLGAGVAVVE